MALDYGKKRTGVAVTDPGQIIANGLSTVNSNDLIGFLKGYMEKEKVETVVVGYPKTMKNKDSESMTYIKPFLKKLKSSFPETNVVLMDERFTSKLALDAMIAGGMKKMDRRNKAIVDEISATIILQSYLERKRNLKGLS